MSYIQSKESGPESEDGRSLLPSAFDIEMSSTGLGNKRCQYNKSVIFSPFGFIAAILVGIFAVSFAGLFVAREAPGLPKLEVAQLSSLVDILRKKFGGIATHVTLDNFNPHVAKNGFMNVYTTASKDASGIYFEVKSKNMGPDKLFVRSDLVVRSQGEEPMLHTQFDGENPLWYFKVGESEETIELFQKQMRLRTSDDDLKPLLEEGAVDRWIAEFHIEDQFSDKINGRYVFSAQHFVEETVFGIHLPPALSLHRLVKVDNYERNINFVIESSAPASAEDDDQDVGIMISLALLPNIPMVGRQADPRIGFFTSGYVDLGEHPQRKDVRPSRRVDTDVRLINRWRLEKKDPSCSSNCEPKTPIVYYIDPSVPKRWQQYVGKGVTAWQLSFSAIGFKDTPRVVYPGSPNWPKDYSAGDIRYATISFSISRDSVFSVGPSIADPRSGEILDADIGFAQEWVKAFTNTIGRSVVPTRRRTNAVKADAARHQHQHPHHHDHAHHHHINSKHSCRRMQVLLESKDLLGDYGQNNVSLDILGNGLADVTTHEVGHTLGLRHNFKGSSAIPLDRLHDKAYTDEHGITASIMDYVAPNIAVNPKDQGDFFPGSHTVGGYDKMAIKYGYTVVAGEVQGVESTVLKSIAADSISKYGFATDGDTDTQDPLARRYDLTSDPVGYSETRFQLVNRLRPGVKARGAKCGDGYACIYSLERSFLHQLFYAARNAANFVGGRVIDHRFPASPLAVSDTGPVQVVHSQYVKTAMRLIQKFFHDEHYKAAASNAADLSFMVKYQSDYDPTFPVFHADILGEHSTMCKKLVDFLLNVRVLKNVQQAHYLSMNGAATWQPTAPNGPTDPTPLSIYELLSEIFKMVWIGPSNEHLCQYQYKWDVQRHVVQQIAILSFDETISTPVQMSALKALEDVRSNATEMIKSASGRGDAVMLMYLKEIVCETFSDKTKCSSRGAA